MTAQSIQVSNRSFRLGRLRWMATWGELGCGVGIHTQRNMAIMHTNQSAFLRARHDADPHTPFPAPGRPCPRRLPACHHGPRRSDHRAWFSGHDQRNIHRRDRRRSDHAVHDDAYGNRHPDRNGRPGHRQRHVIAHDRRNKCTDQHGAGDAGDQRSLRRSSAVHRRHHDQHERRREQRRATAANPDRGGRQ